MPETKKFNSNFSKKKKLIAYILYGIFVTLAVTVMALDYYRTSSILFLLGIIIFGTFHKWNKSRFKKLSSYGVNTSVFLCWMLGLYGVWWDFVSGILYFLWAFFILLTTNHYRNENIFRGIITALSLLFSILAFILYLIFDLSLLD